MDLESYLKLPISAGPHNESPWVEAGFVEVPGGRILICDPMFSYQWNPLPVRPGTLPVRLKFLDHEGRRLVSQLRVGGTSTDDVGELVDTVIVDSAQLGVCDAGRFENALKKLSADQYDKKVSLTTIDAPVGTLYWDDETPMMFFSSGFGDGRYPVRELLEGDERVGFFVDFVPPEEDDED